MGSGDVVETGLALALVLSRSGSEPMHMEMLKVPIEPIVSHIGRSAHDDVGHGNKFGVESFSKVHLGAGIQAAAEEHQLLAVPAGTILLRPIRFGVVLHNDSHRTTVSTPSRYQIPDSCHVTRFSVGE